MAVNAEPTTVDYFIQLLKNKVQSSKPQLKATLPKIKTKGNPATNQNNKQPYHKSRPLGASSESIVSEIFGVTPKLELKNHYFKKSPFIF